MIQRYESPYGPLLLGSYGDRLCVCDWLVEKHHDKVIRRLVKHFGAVFEEGATEIIYKASKELDEFFAGLRRGFDVPLLLVGTDLQKAVWNELQKIPYGEMISYGEMARRIGRPKAVRAIANANGVNAISIFVPCHRVIGSDQSLTGYGGGLETKRRLLELEGAIRATL